jgi:putative phosphoesterase
MRVLLVADIHANWPALRAVSEPHDVCLCVGDLVDYGLEPAPCIDWARRNVNFAVRGNHDHGVAQDIRVNGRNGFKYLSGVTRPFTRERLGADDLRYLAGLPVTKMVTIDGLRFFLVHATPRDPLDEYAPGEAEFWARRLQEVDADVICVGHTHQPYILEVGNKLVVNPGSIGQPRDGDPRAAYAVIEGRKVELKRVAYPVEETVKVIQESGLAEYAKQMLTEVFRTGRTLQKSNNNRPGLVNGANTGVS